MDKAREKTDKRLNKINRKIKEIYKNNPKLKKALNEYKAYMDIVQERTKSDYEAFINETDKNIKAELKKAYSDKILDLTIYSAKYKAVKKNFIKNLSAINQQALNAINNETASIYAENYNQVAVECKRVGIEVVK